MPLRDRKGRLSWASVAGPVTVVIVGLSVAQASAASAARDIAIGLVLGVFVALYLRWATARQRLDRVGTTVTLTNWRGTRVLSSVADPAAIWALRVRFAPGTAEQARIWGRSGRHVLFFESAWDLSELDRVAHLLNLQTVRDDSVRDIGHVGRKFRGAAPTLFGSVRLLMLAIVLLLGAAWFAVEEIL